MKPDAEESKRLHSPLVNYFGPDRGPFRCGNCEYFKAIGQCDHPQVRAPVEYGGCCNLFSNK